MVLMLFIYLGGRPALRCSPSSFDILIKPAMVNAIAIKRQTYLCQSFIHTIKWSLTLVDEILLLDKSLVKNYCHRFVNIDRMRARRHLWRHDFFPIYAIGVGSAIENLVTHLSHPFIGIRHRLVCIFVNKPTCIRMPYSQVTVVIISCGSTYVSDFMCM